MTDCSKQEKYLPADFTYFLGMIQLYYPPSTLLGTIRRNSGHSKSILQTDFYFSLDKPTFRDLRLDYLSFVLRTWHYTVQEYVSGSGVSCPYIGGQFQKYMESHSYMNGALEETWFLITMKTNKLIVMTQINLTKCLCI